VRRVEVQGVEPGVAEGEVEEGVVGVEAEGGGFCWGGGAVLEGVGVQLCCGDGDFEWARGEEEGEGAGWGGVVGRGEDAEGDAGEAEEGLLRGLLDGLAGVCREGTCLPLETAGVETRRT